MVTFLHKKGITSIASIFFIGQQYALGLEPAALLKLMRHQLFKDITAGFNSCEEKKESYDVGPRV